MAQRSRRSRHEVLTQRVLPFQYHIQPPEWMDVDVPVFDPVVFGENVPVLSEGCVEVRQVASWQSSLFSGQLLLGDRNEIRYGVQKHTEPRENEEGEPVFKRRKSMPQTRTNPFVIEPIFTEVGVRRNLSYRDRFRSLAVANYNYSEKVHDSTFGAGQCFTTCYSPNGRFLAATFEAGVIDILHNEHERVQRITKAHESCANNICWMNEEKFASCGDDGKVLTWDVRLLNKPMQIVDVGLNFNSEPLWVKDMSFIPAHPQCDHPAYMLANCGHITTFEVSPSFDLTPKDVVFPSKMAGARGPLSTLVSGRSVVIQGPECPYYMTGFYDRGGALAYWPAVDLCSRPKETRVSPLHIRRTGKENCDPATRSSNHFISGIVPDPVGFGFAVKMQIKPTPNELHSSYTAYYSLKEVELENDAKKRISLETRMIFSVDDTSAPEIHQQPAFSPDGRFLVNPTQGALDILVGGDGSLPFSQLVEDVKKPGEFKVAASVKFPGCGHFNACAVSPRDGWMIAGGCTMGHVHFAKPLL